MQRNNSVISKNRKANLFLCSAPRSGSTQLATWLATHPDISLPPIKEPNYFSAPDFDQDYVRRIHLNDVEPDDYVRSKSTKEYQFAIFREADHYNYLFSQLATKWRLDASTTYLQSPEAPQKIYNYNPDAIIIILTRHPLERALSHYRLAHRTGRTRRSISEQIDGELNGTIEAESRFMLRSSMYLEGIERYKLLFPPENILEIRFEGLIYDTKASLSNLAERIYIDPEQFDLHKEKRNSGDAPIFPKLNVWAMETGLKPMIGRALPADVKSRLRKVLFRKSRQDVISQSDRSALQYALQDEIAAYELGRGEA